MLFAPPDLTSRVLRQERLLVAGGIGLLVALSWWFLATGAGMDAHSSMHTMKPPPFGALVLMWWLMMLAMMLPSAAPAVLLYARVRAMHGNDGAVASSGVFLSGYVAMWLVFSLVAASAQAAMVGPGMAIRHPGIASAILIGAGLYQLSPLKSACLRQCRTPARFLSRHWRRGVAGALRLGVMHGAYCVGCCFLLMGLLFVVGVMNLLWVVALSVLVATEKLLPLGHWIGRTAGVALLLWGVSRGFG